MPWCRLAIQGLDCPVEEQAIRRALEGRDDVRNLRFDLVEGTVAVEFDAAATRPDALLDRIRDRSGLAGRVVDTPPVAAGLPVVEPDAPAQPSRAARRIRRWGPVAASGLAVLVGHALHAYRPAASHSWIPFALAIAVAAVDLLPHALRSLARLRLDIQVLMTLAVTGAVALGQWDEAATVAFLFGLSEALEAMSLERARNAVRRLLDLAPETALLVELGSAVRSVPASSIRPGQHVLVRSGDRIPVDGRVASGRSSVDQKAITGESVPVLREPGDPVYAGTVNGEGALEVEAERPLDDSVVARIAERVRAGQSGRTPIERTVQRFARAYTPAVVAVAGLVMLVPPLLLPGADRAHWFRQGLVLLVIACPCALVIATPVAVVSALASAARRGILVKGGEFLEACGRLRCLAFDKTGTLTRGRPEVVEVVPSDGRPPDELLRVAAALGERGGHVLGQAIARHARGRDLDVPRADHYVAHPGLGATAHIEADEYHVGSHRYLDASGLCPPEFHDRFHRAEQEAGTAVAVFSPSGPLGWLRLADRPRDEARDVLHALRRRGITPVMLTGDNAATSAAIAAELDIRDHRPALLPDDKAAAVRELVARAGPTGMVGDGVNDAPAMVAASTSFAVGGISSGVALEAADVVLMAESLDGLPWLVDHSRRTSAVIRFNIALAVGAKLAFMALALAGKATLWMAIAADMGVSLLVVANALRLLRPHTAATP
jgi:Cd2+/Zn2+-exporting ATPase